MSCRLTALSVFFLLFLLGVQSIDLSHAQPLSSLSDFEFPEIDGSAVEDTCMILAETEATPPPLTTMKVVATTEKPAVQTPPTTPETKTTGTPTRPQPGPITNSQSDLVARLLSYLLANSRGHGADSQNVFFSQPIAGLPHRGHSGTSDSDELVPKWLKFTNGNRWRINVFPSEDSSDES